MRHPKKRPTGGGAAAQSGAGYQNRVAAWLAVRLLAEAEAEPPWGLTTDTTLEFIQCEVPHSVDDILVGTSDSGYVFLQAKRGLQLERKADSSFEKAIEQFVRQHWSGLCLSGQATRPLEVSRDRLVLVVDSTSSRPITQTMPALLRKVSDLPPHAGLVTLILNADERNVCDTLRNQIAAHWRSVYGGEPGEPDVVGLLRLIRVEVLDVEAAQRDERAALDCLRRSILADPERAGAAWAELLKAVGEYASIRSGTGRNGLRSVLLKQGLRLKGVPRYQSDIQRLQDETRKNLTELAAKASVRIGIHTVKIVRESTRALVAALDEGSLLVTGEPGSGKSGALHDLAQELQAQGRNVVLLPVDQYDARSEGTFRTELNLERDLLDVLGNWTDCHPGVLIIDGLDAARLRENSGTFYRIIRQLLRSDIPWTVVASIRRYDLRASEELRQYFSGEPVAPYGSPEFSSVRHLHIPLLDQNELTQVADQWAPLGAVIDRGTPALRHLVGNLFNLKLLAELVERGADAAEIHPIQTQMDLWECYWRKVALTDRPDHFARERVLESAVSSMIISRRMFVKASDLVSDASGAQVLNALLSDGILTIRHGAEGQHAGSSEMKFSHHVLHDFAVARHYLPRDARGLAQLLERDPDLAVVVRPSLVLRLQSLWAQDALTRGGFWETTALLGGSPVPGIAKTLGPAVAVDLSSRRSDCEWLVTALEQASGDRLRTMEELLFHIVGTLCLPGMGLRIAGAEAGPWCQVFEVCGRILRGRLPFFIRVFVSTAVEHVDAMTEEQLAHIGTTARRLLDHFLSVQPRYGREIGICVEAVARTFRSEPRASGELLRRLLEPDHVRQFGYEELRHLTHRLSDIILYDPGFVEQVYGSVFGYEETSTEPVPIGSGMIMPLVSNRRQDYAHNYYTLAEAFPEFLVKHPVAATRAMIAVVGEYVARRHEYSLRDADECGFNLHGHQAILRPDYSHTWDDHDVYAGDYPRKMLDAFEKHIGEIAQGGNNSETLTAVVEQVAQRNSLAVIWRRLLRAGTRAPQTLGLLLKELAWTECILDCHDTSRDAGDLIRAIYPFLTEAERERVERAVLGLPDRAKQDLREYAEHNRDILLGCIPAHLIRTAGARQRRTDLEASGGAPKNERYGSIRPARKAAVEDWYLRHRGVPLNDEPNRTCNKMLKEVEKKRRELADAQPNETDARSQIERLQALFSILQEQGTSLHPLLHLNAWNALSDACAELAKYSELLGALGAADFVRQRLFEAAAHPEPIPETQESKHFNGSYCPAPRICAAEGLLRLARGRLHSTQEVHNAIERLSRDPVPAVRAAIIGSVNMLYDADHALMWCIIERAGQDEPEEFIAAGLVSGPLGKVAHRERKRGVEMIRHIYGRFPASTGSTEGVADHAVNVFLGLFLAYDDPHCREILLTLIQNPTEHTNEANRVIWSLRDVLTSGLEGADDARGEGVRGRAVELLRKAVAAAKQRWMRYSGRWGTEPWDNWPEADRTEFQSLYRFFGHVGEVIYFGSGAHDEKEKKKGQNVAVLTRAGKRKLLSEIEPILRDMEDVTVPPATHHIIEMLEAYMDVAPRNILLRVARMIQASRRIGYQQESFAVSLIVEIVQRFIAEQRDLLQDDAECRTAIREILDVFVEANRPEARQLIYRLDDIFR